MSTEIETTETQGGPPSWMSALASVVALVGMGDSIYLTVHHYTAEPVPCSITNGCEMVLASPYSELFGVPLAAFGIAAYFAAFSLALLTAFGNRIMWRFFGVQTLVMAAFSGWLLYVQAFVIGAFCQYCLLSAGTTFTLLSIFIVSLFLRRRS